MTSDFALVSPEQYFLALSCVEKLLLPPKVQNYKVVKVTLQS